MKIEIVETDNREAKPDNRMDIRSAPGTKVVFSNPNAGYQWCQQIAAQHLKVGEQYTVHRTDVGDWHTDVYLEGFPDIAFNSVLFDKA